MEDLRIPDQVFVYLFFPQHHIRAGIAVEREITVAVFQFMDKRKCCMNLVVKHQTGCVDADFLDCLGKLFSESVVADFSDKCRLLSKS